MVGMAVVKELTTKTKNKIQKHKNEMKSFSERSERSEVGKAKPLFNLYLYYYLLLGRRRSVTLYFLGWAGLTCKPLFLFLLTEC